MANSKRVVFSFDERSLCALEDLKKQGRFSSLGETVRDSVRINLTFRSQFAQGFTDIVVRNPKTGAERTIVIPNLARP